MTTTDTPVHDLTATSDIRIPVDPEHGLLRFAVILTFAISGFGSYLLLNALLADVPFINIIAIIGAILAAVFLTRTVESGLKRRWPSGRYFEIAGDAIRLGNGSAVTREINGAEHVNVLTWRFTITRRTRVPKGWYVVALALMQDDLYLPIYTFMSPDDFTKMTLNEQFTALTASKDTEKTDLRLAGQQRRLRTAEYARWNEGAEMSTADFEQAIDMLRNRFPAWMIRE